MTVMVLSLSCSRRQLMDRGTFWKILSDISHQQANGDLDVQVGSDSNRNSSNSARRKSSTLGGCSKEYSIRAYTGDLRAELNIIGGGCSDDAFLDFRGWLISRGQEAADRQRAEELGFAGRRRQGRRGLYVRGLPICGHASMGEQSRYPVIGLPGPRLESTNGSRRDNRGPRTGMI